MAKTTGENGSSAVAAGKPKRKAIPTAIRNKINEAFDQWAAWASNFGNADEQDEFADRVAAAKKEVFAYINGLLKKSSD